MHSLRKRHRFFFFFFNFSFDLSTTLSFWPAKKNILHRYCMGFGKGQRKPGGKGGRGSITLLGLATDAKVAQYFQLLHVFQRTIYLFQHQACHPSRLDVVPPSGSIWPRGERGERGWVRWAHDQSSGRREQHQNPC